LAGKGQAIINAANKYGINALYLAAHAIHESGYGTSHISHGKNNLFGFGAYDATPFVAAYRFSSIDQNIDYIARQMKATYLNPRDWRYRGPILGYSTKTMSNARIDEASEGMNFYYASDPGWGKAIAAHMERILPYDKTYYAKAKPNMAVPAAPSVPDGKDKFPDGIVAVAKSPMTLSLKKGGAAVKDQIKKGDEFLLLEKTNDYWVKVKFKNKEYWTNSINFVQYKNHLTVKNLARVTADGLNVRPAPSTNKSPIGTLKLNAYVHLVVDKKGNPERDKDKKWHKIKMANGKAGWVSSQYLAIELK
jgi:hypothetical protein